MEYFVFLTVVLLVLALVGLLGRSLGRRTRNAGRFPAETRRPDARDLQTLRRRVDQRAGPVTPWGWPGGRQEPARMARGRADETVPDTFERWADTLLARKRTVDEDPDYRRRAHASVRALFEDRYGGQGRQARGRASSAAQTNGEPAAERPRATQAEVRTPWGW